MNINFIHNKDDSFEKDNMDIIFNYNSSKNLHYNFWNSNFVPETWFDNVAIDLLYVSFSVFAADRLCKRDKAYDSWCRDLKLFIPVLESDLWTANKKLLEETLSFLSGDKWSIEFRPRTESSTEKYYKDKWKKRKTSPQSYNRVCMFSGGLDSFIGAIDLLENTTEKNKVLFVSHYGGGKGTKEYQDRLIKSFCDHYDLNNNNFQQFHSAVINGIEETTRTRSFMFFSHAIVLASTFQKNIPITIPENGLISLNIPSTFSRIGSSSTRTTHPFYMKKLQELLSKLGFNVTINNPYQFKTKGEMLLECNEQTFMKDNISNTMSCSHPDVGRNRGESHAVHCGYCLPCIIRKAAIKKAGITDHSEYYDPDCKKVLVANTNLNSYRQGLKSFIPQYSFMSIQQNGPITDNITEYSELYKRGMIELEEYIGGIE